MALGAWIIFAAPLMATAEPAAPAATDVARTADDIFSSELVLTEEAMRDAAGGTSVAVDIEDLGINTADPDGLVKNVSADGSESGDIDNINVLGNSGFTTVVNNSGTGVIIQNTYQVNIFTGSNAAPQ